MHVQDRVEEIEFQIEISEELSRIEKVKAYSIQEAIDKIRDKYDREEIVLDSSDFKGVKFEPYNETETRIRPRGNRR